MAAPRRPPVLHIRTASNLEKPLPAPPVSEYSYNHLASGSQAGDDTLPSRNNTRNTHDSRFTRDSRFNRDSRFTRDSRFNRDSHFTRDSRFTRDSALQQPQTQWHLSKRFHSRLQLRNLLFENFIKWFLGVTILIFIFATLKIYHNKGNCTDSNKEWFNVIITGLNIVLAINFFSALADLAKILRWRALARHSHSMRDVDLILSADSLAKLTALAFRYYKKGIVRMFGSKNTTLDPEKSKKPRSAFSFLMSGSMISSWLFLNLLAQAVIALIGLTYSFDAGNLLDPAPIGPTFKSDLQHVYQLWDRQPTTVKSSQEQVLHSFGDFGTAFDATGAYSRTDPVTYTNSEQYYIIPDSRFPFRVGKPWIAALWVYRYFNYDKRSFSQYTYAVPTPHTISTQFDYCHRYPVLSGAGKRQSNATVTYLLPDQTKSTLVVDIVGKNATTYIYPGKYSECANGNPRCSVLMAFTEPYLGEPPYVYKCSIEVGHIMNDDGTRHSQDLSDSLAHLVAASAGLSGFGSTESIYTATNQVTHQQFQRYAADSWWSLSGPRKLEYVGSKMAEFSIATLAAMSEFNPKKPGIGASAKLGVVLNVKWWAIAILLPVIGAAHFILFFTAVFLANPYVVRDDSNLADAQLFAPMFVKAGLGVSGSGSYLTGKEIAALCDAGLGHREVVYGAREHHGGEQEVVGDGVRNGQQGDGTFWLGLAEEDSDEAILRRKHSNGVYL